MRRCALIRALVVDPPWKFGDSLPGNGRGAESHYQCMTTDALCKMDLPFCLADDCYLFMWRVAAMVPDAYRLCDAWGFTPKSEIVWVKKTKHGRRWFGMGHHVRAEHEVCIVATRGRPKPKVRNVRSVFEARAGRHSEKPDEFFELIQEMCEGPYAEMFARKMRSGWIQWGNELEDQDGDNQVQTDEQGAGTGRDT